MSKRSLILVYLLCQGVICPLMGPPPDTIAMTFPREAERGGEVWLKGMSAQVEAREGTFSLDDSRYKISQLTRSEDDAFGEQPVTIFNAEDLQGVLSLQWHLRIDITGRLLVKLTCRNDSEQPLHIDRFIVIEGFRPGDWKGGKALHFGVHGVRPLQQSVEMGGVYATATNRPPFTGAFVATSHYKGIVNILPLEGGLRVTAINPADGVRLDPGEIRESEPVWLSSGAHPSTELEHWGDLAGKWNRATISPQPYAAWCTWYSGLNGYMDKEEGVLERFALKNTPLLAEKFAPYGLSCIRLVENSLGRGQGDWPLATSALPNGYEKLASEITRHGMIPGFWADIHRVGIRTRTFAEHPDWLIQGPDGKPKHYKGSAPNHQTFGIPDMSVAGAYDYYYNAARRFREAGYRYCFTDFLGQSIIGPNLLRNKKMTGVEAARRALQALRDGFGADFYFLTQQMPAAFYGLVDAMRTTYDSWGHNLATYAPALSMWFMNRRVMLCDPDALILLRWDRQWNRTWGSWTALAGGAVTFGFPIEKIDLDKHYNYGQGEFRPVDPPAPPPNMAVHRAFTPDDEMLLQRLLPPLASTGRPRDLWEREMPMIIEQALEVGDEQWRVVGLINYRQVPLNLTLNLDRLWNEAAFAHQGFSDDPQTLGTTDCRFLLYDFWAENFLGEYEGAADFRIPQLNGKVIVVRPVKDHPQILAIGCHIGQGIEELQSSSWDAASRTLRFSTKGRRGVVDSPIKLWVPAGWDVDTITVGGRPLSWRQVQENVCALTAPDKDRAVDCMITFSGPASAPAPREQRHVNPALLAQARIGPRDAKNIQDDLPEIWQQLLAKRRVKVEIPEGFKLAFYAALSLRTKGGGLFVEGYDPELGFGLVAGAWQETFLIDWQGGNPWEREPRFTKCRLWYDRHTISYRIDGLSSEETYRVGVTLVDLDQYAVDHTSEVDVVVVKMRNGHEFTLATNVLQAHKPVLHWFDLPSEAVDAGGILLEVRNRSKKNAACTEFWVARRK